MAIDYTQLFKQSLWPNVTARGQVRLRVQELLEASGRALPGCAATHARLLHVLVSLD